MGVGGECTYAGGGRNLFVVEIIGLRVKSPRASLQRSGDAIVTFRRLGFRGRYLVYDLRASLMVQQFFLRSHGKEVQKLFLLH